MSACSSEWKIQAKRKSKCPIEGDFGFYIIGAATVSVASGFSA
jgi:hypothetical protein